MKLTRVPASPPARRLLSVLLSSTRPLAAAVLITAILLTAASVMPHVQAQDEDRLLEQERGIADRFLTVLMRRPRPGTALDRVYGFHVRNDSLDELIASLTVDDSDADAGAKALILGLLHLQRGQAALASEALQQAESRLPNDAACSYYLGRALLAVGRTEPAAAAMERAIERGPARNEALPIFTELGRLYGRAGLNDKALNVWTRLEALFPGDARVGGQIAQTLAEEGNIEEAFKRYTALAKSARPEETRINFAVRAAEMKRSLGKAEEATQDLEKILAQLRPGSWLYTDVRNRIEDGFLKSGDFGALAAYYTKRLENDADNLELRTRLGRILISAGRLDEAQQTLQQAVERAPDNAEVRLALVDLLLNKGETALAAEQFEQLAEQDPDNPDYLLRWGQTLLEDDKQELAERREAAAAVWQKLADARADDAVTLAQVADRMRSIDQQDTAIKIYRQAITTDPDSPQYREYLGEYLHRLERQDEAIEVWESIAADERRGRDSLVRLAEVYATFDLPERSVATWKAAADLDLTFAQELRFASVLRQSKQFDEALERLEIAGRIAESPDERDQLLRDRIATYSEAGTLADQIADLEQQPESAGQQRQLAMMYQAAGQLSQAAEAIAASLKAEPDSVPALGVAADIAEKQNRFADAVALFRRLSVADNRYQTNYLKRVAGLQNRMGQIDEALATCEELIEVNPASTESYQFYARTALQAGRQDPAVEALRRAMNVARRDNGPRNMLAAHFASAYRTDEAIDLYWQALEFESKASDRISMIRRLAPLYDRRNELDRLIERIEELGRKDNDLRTTQLMISAAHEEVQNYGSARQALDRLLAKQPRDVSLLESMVRLCDKADELELAAEFQQRIVSLADTPENRFQLIQLRLDAGLIDITSALSERVSLTSDPVRLGRMIRSAALRQDTSTAIAICEEALRSDAGLWDVRLMLAQLLLTSQGDDKEEKYEQAEALTTEIISADVDPDDRAPTAAPLKTTPGQSARRQNRSSTNPASWSNNHYQLVRTFRLGHYATGNWGYSGQGVSLIQPVTFDHARAQALMLKMVRRVLGKSGDELTTAVTTSMDELATLPPAPEITSARQIWEYLALKSLAQQVNPQHSPSAEDAKLDQKKNERLLWRLAELDEEHGAGRLYGILTQRLQQSVAASDQTEEDDAEPSDADEDAEDDDQLQPLSEEQLQLLVKLYDDQRKELLGKSEPGHVSQLRNYQAILKTEFTLAGHPDRAAEITEEPLADDAPFGDVLGVITFLLQMRRVEEADALVDRLLPAIRRDDGTSQQNPSRSSRSGSMGSIVRNQQEDVRKFMDRHRLTMLDAMLANRARSFSKARSRRSTLSDGVIRTYHHHPQTRVYHQLHLKAPLSTALFDQSAVSELTALVPPDAFEGNQQASKLIVPLEMIAHLAGPLPDAPPHELKTRRALAAFAHWWADRPADCYEALVSLCEDFSDDVDLQIERARLASELGQTRVALNALDSFEPLDSRMLVRREMAAMNLASELGDVDRARQAAERLFGMRMESSTQLALADQLRRLGMKDRATAVLRRMRGGKSRNEQTELQIARAFLAAGDREAAAEVAYSLLRRLNSGRGRQSGNVSYYRRQAVSTLQSAGRMDALIEQAERRLKATPKSMRVRAELSDLYTAAGRDEDAGKLWEDVAGNSSGNAQLLLSRAEALSRAKKHEDAMMMYLDAFEKQPQLLDNNYYKMVQAARQAKAEDLMFGRLLDFPPNSIRYYRVDDLLRLGDRDEFSEDKRAFVVHLMQSAEVRQNLFYILRVIPKSEQQKIPEIRTAIIDSASSDSAFQPNTNTWNISSYSSGGRANGALKTVLEMLQEDEEARQKFDEAAAKALETEANAPTSRLLTAMLQLNDDDLRDDAVSTLREVTAPVNDDAEEDDDKGEDDDKKKRQINGQLLWQAGQILEDTAGIEDRPSLLVAVYEMSANSSNTNQMNNIEYSVVLRLIKAYKQAGMTVKARKHLLDGYHSIDNSQQNQYNPGYGDYQDLQGWKSIADQLVTLNYPIDALAIYHRGISNPTKFERSRRWGGGHSIEDFQTGAKNAQKAITPEVATLHLQALAAESLESEEESAIRLQDLPLDQIVSEGLQTGLALAITTAAESPEGLEALQEISQQLAAAADARPEDWTIPAAQLMIAVTAESADIPAMCQTIIDRLPPATEIAESAGKPTAVRYRPILDLYTPVSFVMKSNDEQTKDACSDLVAYLRTVATAAGDPGAKMAVSSLTGESDGSLAPFLEAIEASLDPGATLSQAQFKTAMRVAQTAASTGDITLSTRAVTLAFGNGPPLRVVGDTGDAFTLNRNRNNNPRDQADDGMSEIVEQLLNLVDVWTDVTGHQLGARGPDESKKPASEIDRQAALNEITDALTATVLPDSRGNAVFPFAKPIASPTNYDRFGSDDKLVPRSASKALASAAAACGRSEELIATLQSRLDNPGDRIPLLGILIDVATAAGDSQTAKSALKRLADEFGVELPEASKVSKPLDRLRSINSQQQQASYRKSEIINRIMHSAWPLATAPEIAAETAAEASEMLNRTVTLINSDSYTAQRHRQVAERIQQQALASAARHNDESLFHQIVDRMLATAELDIARYSEEQQGRIRVSRMQTLLHNITTEGNLHLAHRLLRKLIEAARKTGWDYQSMTPSQVCMDIAKEPKEQQLTLLLRTALGPSDDDALQHGGSIVRYQTPVESVRHQTPRWKEALLLPVCDPDFAVTDTVLMLADVAADLEQSEEVAGKLAARSSEPGDDADIAAALVRLAAAQEDPAAALDTIRPTLEAVAARLQDNRPTEIDKKLRFPDLACYLVVRSIRAGLPFDALADMMDACCDFALYGNQDMLTSATSRFRTMHTRPPGLVLPVSPLVHFVSVALPGRRNPETPTLAPRYAVDDEGWLHATGGCGNSMLMLKYPVTGSFEFTADVADAVGQEASLSYGAVMYSSRGYQSHATVTSFAARLAVEFPAASVRSGEINQESLRISPDKIERTCNGEPWISDLTTTAFPWLGLSQDMVRHTRSGNYRVSGEVTIPDSVNLIDPTMRGWAILMHGAGMADPKLPIGPDQNSDEIEEHRREQAEKLESDYLEAMWSVKEELRFTPATSTRRNSLSHLEYLRPLLDGESVEISFWWETGESALDLTLGRLQLGLHESGTDPTWVRLSDDLASVDFDANHSDHEHDHGDAADSEEKEATGLMNNEDWNLARITRQGQQLEVVVNDQPVTSVTMEPTTRFGIVKPTGQGVRIRSITLTGDWPDQLPENLMERAAAGVAVK